HDSDIARGKNAERAVEATRRRNAVEVRARPDARMDATAEQVAGLVARHLEPRLLHPPSRELVGRILLGRVAGAMLRDRVDLIEPVQDATHPGNARSTRQPRSGKSATARNPHVHDVSPTSAPKRP